MIKSRIASILVGAAALMMCAPVAVLAQAPQSKPEVQQFLNKASQMNRQEERDGANAVNEAGKNLALKNFGNILRADHRVNQEAVQALASKNDIQLSAETSMPPVAKSMKEATGREFASDFAQQEIQDHEEAISEFEKAENEFRNDPQVEMYIKQTLPVLQTHLKEAELLKNHEMKTASR
jgi:putative membrane protein